MIVATVLVVLTAALVAATFLPLLQTPVWWVRALEFSRFQIVTLLGFMLLANLWRGGLPGIALALAVLAALALQATHIRPYSPFSRKEMRKSPAGRGRTWFAWR